MSTGIADELAKFGVEIEHHFGGGVYVKETRIPVGTQLRQHAHKHDHLSWLSSGKVVVSINGEELPAIEGPCMLKIAAHQVHAVRALTDAIWLCIWSTDATDPDKVDEAIL